jgi:uncharacterized protein DUF3179
VYSRNLGERVLSFGHEGVLYRNSFVMYDRETRSLWIHTTGLAVKGELRGETLTVIPSEVVTWRVWAERHPETLVLDRGGEDTGFMGRFGLPGESQEYGLSVTRGGEATLYPYETLMEVGLIQDGPVLVVYDEASSSVRAYLRGERSFEWDEHGALRDGHGVEWGPVTGTRVDGEAGELERLPATAWLMRRWEGFYPDGEVYEE